MRELKENVTIESVNEESLIEHAKRARERAHAPYSNFPVGSAVLADDGRVFYGCNIENSVYNLTMCAERVAIYKAISEGVRRIVRVAVVADDERVTPPCGCCRQMISEFAAPGTTVILANLAGLVRRFNIDELLPFPFDASFLE